MGVLMPLDHHFEELDRLAVLATRQSERCKWAAVSIEDPGLIDRLTRVASSRRMLRLELESYIRSHGGEPSPSSSVTTSFAAHYATDHHDFDGRGRLIFRDILEGENDLREVVDDVSEIIAQDENPRLRNLIDALPDERRELKSCFDL